MSENEKPLLSSQDVEKLTIRLCKYYGTPWDVAESAVYMVTDALYEMGWRQIVSPETMNKVVEAVNKIDDQTVAWDHDMQVRDRAAEYFSELGLK